MFRVFNIGSRNNINYVLNYTGIFHCPIKLIPGNVVSIMLSS